MLQCVSEVRESIMVLEHFLTMVKKYSNVIKSMNLTLWNNVWWFYWTECFWQIETSRFCALHMNEWKIFIPKCHVRFSCKTCTLKDNVYLFLCCKCSLWAPKNVGDLALRIKENFSRKLHFNVQVLCFDLLKFRAWELIEF